MKIYPPGWPITKSRRGCLSNPFDRRFAYRPSIRSSPWRVSYPPARRPAPAKAAWRHGAQNDAIVELDLNAAIARHIPGLVGAEKQVDLFQRALDIDHIGKMGSHLGIVPIDRRQDAGFVASFGCDLSMISAVFAVMIVTPLNAIGRTPSGPQGAPFPAQYNVNP